MNSQKLLQSIVEHPILIRWLYITLATLGTLLLFLIWTLNPLTSWRLKKIPLNKQPELAALSLITTTIQPSGSPPSALTVFRPFDGQSQNMHGTWQLTFIGPQQLALFGSTPSQPQLQRFYLFTKQKITTINISKLPGAIGSVVPNPAGSYLLLSGRRNQSINNQKFYYCVLISGGGTCHTITDIISKKDWQPDGYYDWRWNQSVDNELIITNSNNPEKIFINHPPETISFVTTTAYLNTQQLTNRSSVKLAITPQNHYTIKRYFWLTFIADKRLNKKHYFLLPPGAKLGWVGTQTMLIVNGQQTRLLNILTRAQSDFITLPPAAKKISTYYSAFTLDS